MGVVPCGGEIESSVGFGAGGPAGVGVATGASTAGVDGGVDGGSGRISGSWVCADATDVVRSAPKSARGMGRIGYP